MRKLVCVVASLSICGCSSIDGQKTLKAFDVNQFTSKPIEKISLSCLNQKPGRESFRTPGDTTLVTNDYKRELYDTAPERITRDNTYQKILQVANLASFSEGSSQHGFRRGRESLGNEAAQTLISDLVIKVEKEQSPTFSKQNSFLFFLRWQILACSTLRSNERKTIGKRAKHLLLSKMIHGTSGRPT